MTAFHEVLFPLDIALGSAGGPERRTEIVALGSGREERNARWAHSRRRYDAGYGIKTLGGAVAGGRVLRGAARPAARLSLARPARSFFRRAGRRGGADSTRRSASATATTDDVSAAQRPTAACYAPYARPIAKPVAGSVRVAVDGVRGGGGRRLHLRCRDGLVTFLAGHVPADGAAVTAGFLFDVPVRFDTDYLEVDLSAFAAGAIPKIPLVEIRV